MLSRWTLDLTCYVAFTARLRGPPAVTSFPRGGGAPCGACREMMAQLMPDGYQKIEILLDWKTGRVVTLDRLMPEWWI